LNLSMLPAVPTVSVIVNTLNRARSLENTLLGLRQLRYPSFEIIVVCGPCTDDTLAMLERYRDDVRIASCPEANLSISRNLGLSLAANELVAFIDDDSIPEPDWLDRLVEGLSTSRAAAVGGFIRDNRGFAYQHQIITANRLGEARDRPPPGEPLGADEFVSPTGTNICFRRERLLDIGGFDEEFGYFLEETDVNLRLHERGWSISYAPEAEVQHYFLENEMRSRERVPRSLYQIARSKAYFCWTHGRARYPDRIIQKRLNDFRAQQRRNLWWFALTGRLSRSDTHRLLGEIDRGFADGARTADAAADDRQASRPVEAGRVPPRPAAEELANGARRPRLCWIEGLKANVPSALPAAMVSLGHEVTMISPAKPGATAIRFDGVWRHRLGRGVRPGYRLWERYERAAVREVGRIQPRRRFDFVFCSDDARAAFAPLSELGIDVVAAAETPESAGELDGFVRSALASRPI
jgi:glycogen synthase